MADDLFLNILFSKKMIILINTAYKLIKSLIMMFEFLINEFLYL